MNPETNDHAPSPEDPHAVDDVEASGENLQQAPVEAATPPVPVEEEASVAHESAPEGAGDAALVSPMVWGGGVALLVALFLGWLLRPRPRQTQLPVPDSGAANQEAPSPDIAELVEAPPPMSMVDRLRERMASTRDLLQGRLDHLFRSAESHDELFEGLEEVLLVADVGAITSTRLIDS